MNCACVVYTRIPAIPRFKKDIIYRKQTIFWRTAFLVNEAVVKFRYTNNELRLVITKPCSVRRVERNSDVRATTSVYVTLIIKSTRIFTIAGPSLDILIKLRIRVTVDSYLTIIQRSEPRRKWSRNRTRRMITTKPCTIEVTEVRYPQQKLRAAGAYVAVIIDIIKCTMHVLNQHS